MLQAVVGVLRILGPLLGQINVVPHVAPEDGLGRATARPVIIKETCFSFSIIPLPTVFARRSQRAITLRTLMLPLARNIKTLSRGGKRQLVAEIRGARARVGRARANGRRPPLLYGAAAHERSGCVGKIDHLPTQMLLPFLACRCNWA